jgi:hypothetical protein
VTFQISKNKVANLAGRKPFSIGQAWSPDTPDNPWSKGHVDGVDAVRSDQLKDQVAPALHQYGRTPQTFETIQDLCRAVGFVSDCAALRMRDGIEIGAKNMQRSARTRPVRMNMARYASTGQNRIDQWASHPGTAEPFRFHNGMRPHAKGLATNKDGVSLSPKNAHSAAVFIRCDVEMMIIHRTDAPIEADRSVCKDSHAVT